jgi:hypothetical protein
LGGDTQRRDRSSGSALRITAARNPIWAAGEHGTVAQIADPLLSAQVVRAVELDINPAWVAGYL